MQWINNMVPNVTLLKLDNSNIANIPRSVGQLQQLQELSLADNPIVRIPDTMNNLSQLRELDLTNATDNLSFTARAVVANLGSHIPGVEIKGKIGVSDNLKKEIQDTRETDGLTLEFEKTKRFVQYDNLSNLGKSPAKPKRAVSASKAIDDTQKKESKKNEKRVKRRKSI